MTWHLILQLHKKGSSSTTVQSYTPTEQEVRMQQQMADYAEAVAPNALRLNNTAAGLLYDNLGTMQVDYNSLLENASQLSTAAQNGVTGLTYGVLPEAYQQNMENSIKSGVENSLGSALSNLSNRGVLSSSVANNAIQNISANAASTMADNYLNNISTLNGLYGQQASLAGNNISLAAAAQEAAQQPALNLWNASLGLNQGGSGAAASALSGTGTTTTTSSTSGGSFLGGLFGGLASSYGSGLMSSLGSSACFTDETKIKMADGTEKYIRHIQPDDKVLSVNKDGVEEEATVTKVTKPVYQMTYAVVVRDNSNNNKAAVYTTLTQPLKLSDGSFKEVEVLRINDELWGAGKVLGIAESGERKVYDFAIDNDGAYYANGFVAQSAYPEQFSSEETE